MKIKWKFVPLCAPRHKYVRTHTHTFTLHANSIRSERQPSVPNACWPNLIHTFGREKNGVRIHTALAYTHRPISSWFRNRYWYLLRHTNAINRIYLRQHSVSLPKNKIARLNQIIMRFITWMIFPWLWCLRSEQSVRVRCVQSPRARSGIFFSSFFQICKYAQLYIEHAYSRIHTNTHHTLTSSLLHSCASDNVCVCVSEWMCDTVEAHADILQHISCQLWFFCSSHLSHVWVTSVRVCECVDEKHTANGRPEAHTTLCVSMRVPMHSGFEYQTFYTRKFSQSDQFVKSLWKWQYNIIAKQKWNLSSQQREKTTTN